MNTIKEDEVSNQIDHKSVELWSPNLDITAIKSSIMAIKGNFLIPEMPKLITSLSQLINTPFPNARQITNLIEDNSVVTGDILGTVNSPAFQASMRSAVEVRSIRQCLNLFGLERLYQMTVASAMKGVNYDDTIAEKVVNTSAILAKSCGIIARFIPNVSVQTAYFYGLFLHSGMVILAMQKNKGYAAIFEKSIQSPNEAINLEITAFSGARHDYLGVAVARKWGIGMHPKNIDLHKEDTAILLAIQEHHHPHFYAINDELIRNLIAIANLAQHYMCSLVYHSHFSDVDETIKNQSIALLGLDDNELFEIERMISESLFNG